MNKKIILSTVALLGVTALVGCGGTTDEISTTPDVITPPVVDSIPICDGNGNVYASEQEAKSAGLSEAEYGATYCQQVENEVDKMYDVAMGNATYTIEEEEITLVNGKFEQPAAPGSATMMTAELSDDTIAMGDLNKNKVEDDYAGIIFYDGGGSGTFAYVVALVDGEGTNGVMIGDRVPVDSVKIDDAGIITVQTYERADGEAMADAPSIQITKTFVVNDEGVLTEQK